jgi:hypothetical protein
MVKISIKKEEKTIKPNERRYKSKSYGKLVIIKKLYHASSK